MPRTSAARLQDELLLAYETVEDPRRLLEGLLISLADCVGADKATMTEVIPTTDPTSGKITRRLALRASFRRDGHPPDPHRSRSHILPDHWLPYLKVPTRWEKLAPDSDPESPFSSWLDPHLWAIPLWRRNDLVGILWLDPESSTEWLSRFLEDSILTAIRTVFLPALSSHRAFARFLRYEASTDRQLGIRPEARLRTPAERLFPRARQDLGALRMFIIQYDERQERFRDLALQVESPETSLAFQSGVTDQGVLGCLRDHPSSVEVRPVGHHEYTVKGSPVSALPAEAQLFGDSAFRLYPIRFEKRFVGIFGHEQGTSDPHRDASARLQAFLSTTARNLFYSSIYRSLLADSYRLNTLQWATGRLTAGHFDIDHELAEDPSENYSPDEVRDAKSLADLADDFHHGLDDLFGSFQRLVVFVDTFYQVGLASLEERAEGDHRSVTEYLQRVVNIIRDRLGYEKVMALLADPTREVLHRPVLSWEFESPEQANLIRGVEVEYTKIKRSVWAWCARNLRDIYVPDAYAPYVETDDGEKVFIRREWIELFKAKSFFALPLVSQQSKERKPKLLGVLSIAALEKGSVEKSDMNVIRALANQIALILENASLHEEQRQRIREQQAELEKQKSELQENYYRLFSYERQEFHLDLTAGLAHDLKNPLIAGKQYLRILGMDLQRFRDASVHRESFSVESLEAFEEKATGVMDRIGEVLQVVQDRLKDIEHRASESDPEQPREQRLDPRSILEIALDDIPQTARVGVEIHRDLRDVAPVKAHPDGLRSLFMNLVVNAIEAIPSERGGDIWISLRQEKDEIIYEVEDNGCGIPPENIEKIFHARFSTKPRGTGLGLAWVQRNVTQHLGGTIHVESELQGPEHKTRFTVRLPIHVEKE